METIEILIACAITAAFMLPLANLYEKWKKELSQDERDE